MLKFDIYYNAGINAFWQYGCLERMGNQKESNTALYVAIAFYNQAEDIISDLANEKDYYKRKSKLDNWIAVMEINKARHSDDEESRVESLDTAEKKLFEAIDLNPRHYQAYLNLAEVYLAKLARIFGIKYNEPISTFVHDGEINEKDISELYSNIEKYLYRARLINPDFINVYYKMGQLYTYKIFYELKIKKNTDISQLTDEADKWFEFALLKGGLTQGYLFTYREYMELVNIEHAKELNKVIYKTNHIAAQKWDRMV